MRKLLWSQRQKNSCSFFKKYKLIALAITLMLGLSGCAQISQWADSFNAPRSGDNAPVENIGQTPKYYTVKAGDSLYSISQSFGITERALILWNQLKAPYTVTSGERLKLFPPKGQSKKLLTQNDQTNLDNTDEYNDIAQQSTSSSSNEKSYQALIQDDTPIIETDDIKSSAPIKVEKPQAEVAQTKPTEEKPTPKPKNYYIVQPGDTLLGIASDYDLSLTDIASLNDISEPYYIYIGQKLLVNPKLKPKAKQVVIQSESPKPIQQVVKRESPKVKIQEPEKTQTTTKIPEVKESKPESLATKNIVATKTEANLSNNAENTKLPNHQSKTKIIKIADQTFDLPINGKVTDDQGKVFIEGTSGENVKASASGKVIYAGVGISGYGKTIIIDHGNGILSAYSNLSSLSVKENEPVNQGQSIGELGKFDGETLLDFEIRQNGNLIDVNKMLS